MQIPEIGFLREKQILGDPRNGIAPLIPVKRSFWWQNVKSGRFPAPIRIAPRVTVWRAQDIRDLILRLDAEGTAAAADPGSVG